MLLYGVHFTWHNFSNSVPNTHSQYKRDQVKTNKHQVSTKERNQEKKTASKESKSTGLKIRKKPSIPDPKIWNKRPKIEDVLETKENTIKTETRNEMEKNRKRRKTKAKKMNLKRVKFLSVRGTLMK